MIHIRQSAIQKKNATQRREVHFLDETLAKTKLWLKEIQKETGIENQREAYAALRAVLHALRDRLLVEEAVQLGAQLPTVIRGMYYDGWICKNKPEKIRTAQEFLERIADDIGRGRLAHGHDVAAVTRGVVQVLKHKITAGEMNDVQSSLPNDIVRLWAAGDSQYFPRVESSQQEEPSQEEREAAKWKEDKPSESPRDVIAWDQPE